jgi:alpha-tubulin suppressor-like RCC1 family protein
VTGNISFQSISTEFFHTCALTTSGSAYCWGQNAVGALGAASPDGNAYAPVAVTGAHTFKAIAVGYEEQSCALDTSFKAFCWGIGGVSGTGDTAAAIYTPEAVQGGLQFVVLRANGSRVCGVIIGGAGYCWGDGRQGELGNDTTETATTPAAIAGGLSFTDVQPSQLGHFTCGLTNSGVVYCWGHDANILGDTTLHKTPLAVGGSLRFEHLSVGGEDVCGLTDSGDAYCWGLNASGELADGTTTPSTTPRKIPAP